MSVWQSPWFYGAKTLTFDTLQGAQECLKCLFFSLVLLRLGFCGDAISALNSCLKLKMHAIAFSVRVSG